MMIKLLVAAAVAASAAITPVAHGDINVEIPSPDSCPYPGLSEQGMAAAMVASFWWSCDFPIEENGSRWHCYYFGAAGQGNLGFSMMIQAGIAGPVGGMLGGCHWVCPDGRISAPPNPPGAWKYALVANKCVALAIQPISEPDPIAVPPPEAGLTPAVTNPDNPNPDATVNP